MALPVSATWKEAVQAQFRFQAYFKFKLTLTPPDIREGMTPSGATESITSLNTIKDGDVPETPPCATLEPLRWKGDGSMYLPSDNPEQNLPLTWWSSLAVPMDLTFTFDKVYTIPGIFATWDTETKSWPTDFYVNGYDLADTLVKSYHVTNVTSVDGFLDVAMDGVKKVVLSFKKWSKAGWRARVAEILFGLVVRLEGSRINQVDYSESAFVNAEKLPTQSMSIKLQNYDKYFDPSLQTGVAKYLSQRQQAAGQWGFMTSSGVIEWLEAQPMYVNVFTIGSSDTTVSLEMTNRLAFMTSDYIDDFYNNTLRDMKSIALTVLQNSNIIRESDTIFPWELPDALSTFKTKAPMPVVATNSLLQLIAQATGHVLDINPSNGYVRFKATIPSSGYTIGEAQALGFPQFDPIGAALKSIKVGVYQYTTSEKTDKVYDGKFNISGQQILEITYSNNALVVDPSVTVTEATVVSAQYFGYRARVTVSAPSVATEVTISIQGKKVESSVTYLEIYNDPTVISGREFTIENPLITEVETVTALTPFWVAYYKQRRETTLPYLGYPELEAGETIEVESTYGKDTMTVNKLDLSFNGGWSGTLGGVME